MSKPSIRARLAAATHNAGVRVAGDKGAKVAATINNTLLDGQLADCGDACGPHCADSEHVDVLRRIK